ncbi:MAG TPA: hypothetical protein GXZ36_05435 [Firmicutes bacterium]|nr:hypothetical protein [Bacillota bacterium]
MQKRSNRFTPVGIMLSLCLSAVMPVTPVWAVEAGGEIEVSFSGALAEDGDFTDDQFADSLDLEFFLPPLGETEISYAFRIGHPLQGLTAGKEASYFTKKLYLRRKFDRFHLTVGRQPVSWSFGSLLNPVDYTLGAVALDEENNSKYTDAVEVYTPLNWNSSLSLVTSFPAGFDLEAEKMKWGVRGRFGVKGYDLTVNYVREAAVLAGAAAELTGLREAGGAVGDVAALLPGILPRQRAGFAFKGDLGEIGFYGAYGHYFGDGVESSNSYLLGADYSYNLNYNTKITMQLEYIGVELNFLEPAYRTALLKLESDDDRLDLLAGAFSYPVDDFSTVSLITLVNLDDGSLFLTPEYQTTLPGNLDLTVNTTVFLGGGGTLLAPGDQLPQVTFCVTLSYPF